MNKSEALIELAREQLSRGIPLRLKLYGSSMLPSIPPGSEATVVPYRFESLKAGDVVLFINDGRFICHRVIKRICRNDRDLFLTRGDFTLKEDEPLTLEMFLGRVTEIRTGTVRLDLDSPFFRIYGRFVAAASPFAGFLRRIKLLIINRL